MLQYKILNNYLYHYKYIICIIVYIKILPKIFVFMKDRRSDHLSGRVRVREPTGFFSLRPELGPKRGRGRVG